MESNSSKPQASASIGRLIAAIIAAFVAGSAGFVAGLGLVSLSQPLLSSPSSMMIPLLMFAVMVVGAVKLVGRIGRPAPSLEVPSFAGPQLPPLYLTTLEALRASAEGKVQSFLLFLLSVALFYVTTSNSGNSVIQFATLIAVLLFHELGHLTMMRAFGYRNTSIFFIPGLGAATVGTRENAPAWQQALVALAGPVPGLLAGVLWLRVNQHASLAMRYPGDLMIWINAFNLLPLAPLDGGKLFNLLIFSRHRGLEVIFLGVTSIALGAVGLDLGTTLLLSLAVVGLLFLPTRYRIARAADALRARWPVVPSQLTGEDGEFQRDLFREVFPTAARIGTPAPAIITVLMRSVHTRAQVRPASWSVTVLMLALYLLCVGLALYAVAATLPSPTV